MTSAAAVAGIAPAPPAGAEGIGAEAREVHDGGGARMEVETSEAGAGADGGDAEWEGKSHWQDCSNFRHKRPADLALETIKVVSPFLHDRLSSTGSGREAGSCCQLVR